MGRVYHSRIRVARKRSASVMIEYLYECEKCGRFDHSQSISSPTLETCPTCNSPCERLISGGIHASVKQEITTIGQLSERNTKKMGKGKLEELSPPKKEEVSPTGLTKDTYKKLSKMTPERKTRWILEGK
ncbi:MAG: FmdB family zinc ribbon protein [Nitrososphaerales archaeon]